LKYRDKMTAEEEAALLGECERLEQCYADADAIDAANAELHQQKDGDYECFDPVRDGWVGKDGRP
jgi:hypothetical protein